MSIATRQCPGCKRALPVPDGTTAGVCPGCGHDWFLHLGRVSLRESRATTPTSVRSAWIGQTWSLADGRYPVVAAVDWWNEREQQLSTELCLRRAGSDEAVWLECEPGEGGDELWWRYQELDPVQVHEGLRGPEYAGQRYVADGPVERYRVRAVAGSFDPVPAIGSRNSTRWYEPADAGRGREALLGRSDEDGETVWYLLQPIAAPGSARRAAVAGVSPAAPTRPRSTAAVASYASLGLILGVIALLLHLLATRPGFGARLFNSGERPSQDAAHWISEPFAIAGGTANVESRVFARVDNSWLRADVCLINVDTRRRRCLEQRVEYYHGVDGEGAWSEGSREHAGYFSSIAPGTYRLQLHAEAQDPRAGIRVLLRRDVPRHRYLALALLLLSVPPVLQALQRHVAAPDRFGATLTALAFYGLLFYQSWP